MPVGLLAIGFGVSGFIQAVPPELSEHNRGRDIPRMNHVIHDRVEKRRQDNFVGAILPSASAIYSSGAK